MLFCSFSIKIKSYFRVSQPWDMAAAMLIVSEAGGITADPADGTPLDFTSGRVSASNSRELLQLFLQCVNASSASSGSNASRL